MKYLSVCSGIEAATVAWHRLGWEPVGFSEIEPFPSAVLAHHYPHVPNFGDMTKFQEWPLDAGAIDLLVGGTPCQSFSVAGLRQGLRDPRGNLMLTYLAIAARLRPRWVVWENVPGVLSSNGGRDFGSLLGGLVQLGYGISYRILDAQWVRTYGHPRAVPQRRRRVFVVGCLGDATAAATILFERESVQRHSKKSGAAREEIASDVEASTRSGCWWDGAYIPVMSTDDECNPGIEMMGPFIRSGQGGRRECVVVPIQDGREINKQQNGIGVGQPGDPAYTLDTTGAQAVYTKAKRAQSDTDDETWVEGQVNPTPSLFDCGDVRATTIAIQGNLIGRDKGGPQGVGASTEGAMYTMTKADVHGVAVAFHPTQDPISSIDGSVHAMGCGSSGGCATQAVAFPINTMTLGGRPDEANDRKMTMGVGADGDPQFTLQAAHSHAVAIGTDCYNGAITGDVAATMGTPGSSVNASGPTVMQTMTVRRLTPRECERLQGFPDDYTLIPWRKKVANDCPDGPRYKALGNSMAVNCMEWIGERIAALEAEKETT